MNIGFIGTGNMAGALVRALRKTVSADQIWLSNRTKSKAETLANEIGGNVCSNLDIAKNCQVIYLGVKPNMMQDLLSSLAPILKQREQDFVLISMASGLSLEELTEYAGGNYPIIRIMPNTPAAVGEGMILYCANSAVTPAMIDTMLSTMSAAGRFDEITEKQMDAGSAVAGCGPAFACLFMEALADGGVECGLSRKQALEYAAQMLLGSAKLVLESGQHPGALKDAVCSPGGSTIAGVHALESGGFRAAAMNAVKAAYEKTKYLK